MEETEIISFLKGLELFSDFTEEELHLLLPLTQHAVFKKGTFLIHEGDKGIARLCGSIDLQNCRLSLNCKADHPDVPVLLLFTGRGGQNHPLDCGSFFDGQLEFKSLILGVIMQSAEVLLLLATERGLVIAFEKGVLGLTKIGNG